MEKTLILLKPDAVQRGKIGDLISRFENKGLKIVGLKMMQLNSELLSEHYSHLTDKPFFPSIVEFMSSTPVVAVCLEGKDTVNQIRRMVGLTDGNTAEVGSIRGDFGNSVSYNLIHASDSKENAEIEVKRFFNEDEIFEYGKLLDEYIY
jgi:nucleoside-diphosphate kinase